VRSQTRRTVAGGCGKSCEQLDPTLSGKREVWLKTSHHSSSGLYSTRLETRTKESNMYASRTVLSRLVGRNESKWCDALTLWGRSQHPAANVDL
jgi:hypothetical protein